jgi:hypothetical protein
LPISYRNNRKLGSGRRDQFRRGGIAASMVADLDQVRHWMIERGHTPFHLLFRIVL